MGSRCLCYGVIGKPNEQYCGELVNGNLIFCNECNGGRGCNQLGLPDAMIDPDKVTVYNQNRYLSGVKIFRIMFYLVAVLLILSTGLLAGVAPTAFIITAVTAVFFFIGLKGKLFDESNGNP
jgi:hypothetical protein